MTKRTKERLLKFLYPSDEARSFMCNDFYQELLKVIPIDKCVSKKIIHKQKRISGVNYVRRVIKKFINEHKEYREEIDELYYHENIYYLIETFIIGFIFYILNTTKGYEDVDLFNDKRCILYERKWFFMMYSI